MDPTWSEGLSISLKGLTHKPMGPPTAAGQRVGTNCCGQTSTTPGLKARASILLQAPSAELAASLGTVTRCVPSGPPKDTEA